jgi:hypothetical protein
MMVELSLELVSPEQSLLMMAQVTSRQIPSPSFSFNIDR